MAKLEKLLNPWLEYRVQWDLLLESAVQIRSWPEEEVFLLRHMVKGKFMLAPRESVDVVKVLRLEDGSVIYATTGASHVDYPPLKGYVRTHQYLGCYHLKPLENNSEHTRFQML